jgi:hypothetical protein
MHPYALMAGFVAAAVFYDRIYARLTQFRWWPSRRWALPVTTQHTPSQ